MKFLPLSLIILLGQPGRLTNPLILDTEGSIPGVKSKIIAVLMAHMYNVTYTLKVLSDCP